MAACVNQLDNVNHCFRYESSTKHVEKHSGTTHFGDLYAALCQSQPLKGRPYYDLGWALLVRQGALAGIRGAWDGPGDLGKLETAFQRSVFLFNGLQKVHSSL